QPDQHHARDRLDVPERQCRAEGSSSRRYAGHFQEYHLARERFTISPRRNRWCVVSETDQITIVNVDDQDAPRYVKTRDLQENGFTVIEARTGAEALRIIEAEKPPVVLLDVELPDITGYDVCIYVKKKWPGVMVLMTSSTFTPSFHRTRGLDSGADSYLVQPAEPLELAAAVNALLRVRGGEDNMRALNATLEQRVKDRVADLEAANLQLKHEMEQRQRAETALV